MIFFMVMYLLSFITGKSLNLQEILTFLVPVITHTTHLLYTNSVNANAVSAAKSSTSPESITAAKAAIVSNTTVESQSPPQPTTNGHS